MLSPYAETGPFEEYWIQCHWCGDDINTLSDPDCDVPDPDDPAKTTVMCGWCRDRHDDDN